MKHLIALIITVTLISITGCKEDDLKAPSVPELISPANLTTDAELNLTFNWEPSKEAKTYSFQLSLSSDFTTTIKNLSAIEALSITVEDLMPATKYYWRVNAKNSAGISGWSDVWELTTEPLGIPQLTAPNNNATLTVTGTTLTWSAISDADDYTLQVSAVEDFSSTILNVDNLTATNYNVSGLDWFTTYYWRVRANIDLCSSEWSEVWTFTPKVPIPTSGLVAYYPFNGNANDASGNNNHGTVNGATLATDRKGSSSKAYLFDGVDDYITVPHTQALNLLGEFTISVWINSDGCNTPCSQPAYHTIINKRDESVAGDNWPWSLAISYIDGPKEEFKKVMAHRRNSFNFDYQVSENQISINTWLHVVVVLKNNVQSIYVNGELDSSYEFVQGQFVSTENVIIGWNLRPGFEQYKGLIDDIRLYSKALTSDEILALYNE